MKLYLIRHGQTDWNVKGKIQGRHDIALNENGKEQARQLALGMKARPISHLFSSHLTRAKETADAIGKRQNIAVTVLDELQEVNFGLWEGLTYQEVQARDAQLFTKWRINPVEVSPPEGENQIQIFRRCRSVMQTILQQSHHDIAIVSHGAMLAHLISFLLPDHPEQSEIIVGNASITTIQHNSLTADFQLIEVNNISHLY